MLLLKFSSMTSFEDTQRPSSTPLHIQFALLEQNSIKLYLLFFLDREFLIDKLAQIYISVTYPSMQNFNDVICSIKLIASEYKTTEKCQIVEMAKCGKYQPSLHEDSLQIYFAVRQTWHSALNINHLTVCCVNAYFILPL